MLPRLLSACAACCLVLATAGPARAAVGDIDATFGENGVVTTQVGFQDFPGGMALAPDGSIVTAGQGVDTPVGQAFVVARHRPDGALDPSFSGDGLEATRASGDSGALAVAVQPDNKIVAAGYVGNYDFAVVRYLPDGQLDPSFSGDGIQTLATGTFATGVALQSDGKIVVVGGDTVARFDTGGQLDPDFSGDGIVTGDGSVQVVAVQPDDRVVVAGAQTIKRYRSNGSLDPDFSGDGIQDVPGIGQFSQPGGIAFAPGGGIVVAGAGQGATVVDTVATVTRFQADGTLDTGFSGDGVAKAFDGYNQGVLVQPDGRVVAVGGTEVNGESLASVRRYLPDGAPDTSFSGDGLAVAPSGSTYHGSASVALQPGGKILTFGEAAPNGRDSFALARFIGAAPPVAATGAAPAPVARDTTAPTITAAKLSARVFSIDGRARASAARKARGTRLSFRLSEPATVVFVTQQRVGRRWRTVRVFGLRRPAGKSTVPYSGKIKPRGRQRALRAGRYRIRMRPSDRAGNRGRVTTVGFRIVK